MLLLDEPFGALDEFTREHDEPRAAAHLDAAAARPSCFVTHNIQEAVFLADRVLVMSARPGRLAQIIDVDLERPRVIPMQREQRFQDYVFTVRKLLGVL